MYVMKTNEKLIKIRFKFYNLGMTIFGIDHSLSDEMSTATIYLITSYYKSTNSILPKYSKISNERLYKMDVIKRRKLNILYNIYNIFLEKELYLN